jgi:DNA-binding MarR family transcriptional regulator
MDAQVDASNNSERDRILLEEIELDPDTTQATLAQKLGVAVGTVNWHVKRLIAKGYVKVKRAERRKLRYIITPEGISLRARLTVAYIENSMHLYRASRAQARKALHQARERGYKAVTIEGDGDLAEIVRLTCLELGIEVADGRRDETVGVVRISGQKIRLHDPA